MRQGRAEGETLVSPGEQSQKAVCVRFLSGNVEYTFVAELPKVGERLKRGDGEWEILAVEKDSSDNVVVTLGLPRRSQTAILEID